MSDAEFNGDLYSLHFHLAELAADVYGAATEALRIKPDEDVERFVEKLEQDDLVFQYAGYDAKGPPPDFSLVIQLYEKYGAEVQRVLGLLKEYAEAHPASWHAQLLIGQTYSVHYAVLGLPDGKCAGEYFRRALSLSCENRVALMDETMEENPIHQLGVFEYRWGSETVAAALFACAWLMTDEKIAQQELFEMLGNGEVCESLQKARETTRAAEPRGQQ